AAARTIEITEMLIEIGWAEVTRDLDFLSRIAADNPALLAEMGVDDDDLDARVALAAKIQNPLDPTALSADLATELARRGLRSREGAATRRARIVGARRAFARSLGAGSAEQYDPAAWHPALSLRE